MNENEGVDFHTGPGTGLRETTQKGTFGMDFFVIVQVDLFDFAYST